MKRKLLFLTLVALMMPFAAKAQISTFPYLLDFENGLDGWTALNSGQPGNWQIVNQDNTHSGDNVLASYSYYDNSPITPDNWFISPAIELGSTAMQLTWYECPYSSSYLADHYAVYISTSGNDTASFTATTPVLDTTLSAGTWVKKTVSLAAYADQTIYIAFRHYNCYNEWAILLDDIAISVAPSCDAPTYFTITDITTTGATLNWSASADYTNVELILDSTSLGLLSDTSYTLTGLTPNTTYNVKLIGQCTVGGVTEDLNLSFSTNCESISDFPYNCSFEQASEINCWHAVSGWSSISNAQYSASGTGSIYGYNTSNASYIVSPTFEIPAVATGYSMQVKLNGVSYYWSLSPAGIDYQIYVSTSATTTFDSSFVMLLDSTTDYEQGYEELSFDLSSYAGQSITFAIAVTSVSSYSYMYLFVDDFSVRSASMPVAIMEGPSSIDIGLTGTFIAHMTSGDSTNITYTWTSARVAAGDATMVDDNDTLRVTYNAGTADTVTVSIDNGNGTATATMLVHLRDCSAIDSLPWLEDFTNTGNLECWSALDLDGDGQTWSITTGPDNYLHAPYNTYGPDDWLLTPAFNLPNDDADALVLSWKVSGDSYDVENYYQVLVSPTAGTDAASFTDTLFSESYSEEEWADRAASLAQYAGQTVRFAFRHINIGDDDGMDIDDISVRLSTMPVLVAPATMVADINTPVTITATLQEGSTDGLLYTWSSVMANAGDATMNATDNTLSITYTSVGIDTVAVVAENASGRDSATIIVTVRDLSPFTDMPYYTSFEIDEDTNWYFANSTNGWYLGSAVAAAGTRSLYISNDNGANNTYTTSTTSASYAYRAITLAQAGDYTFSFKWHGVGESTYDYLRAFMVPSTTEFTAGNTNNIDVDALPEGYIAMDGGSKLNLDSTWVLSENPFSVPTAGTYLMVFYWKNDYSQGVQPAAAVDSITLSMLPCASPSNLAIDSTTPNSIALHWTARGEEDSWLLTIGDSAIVVDDTAYVIEDLEANTEYSISVRTICDEGDTSFATTTSTRTECSAITLPYFESFENGGDACWSQAASNSTNSVDLSSYMSSDGSNSLNLYMLTMNSKTYAIMPAIDDVSTLMVTFKCRDESYSDGNTIEVGTMSDPQNTGSFVPFYSTTCSSTEWEEHEVLFSGDTTNNRYIAFRSTAASSYTSLYIDEVTVMVAPSCARPGGVSVTNITATSADVVIEDSTLVNNYRVVVISNNDTVINTLVTDTLYSLTGLDANTSYTVIVYAECPDGNTTNTRSTTFRTECTNGSCEFTVVMSDSFGDGWNGNAINVMQNGTLYESLTIANGNSNTVTARPCLGDPVALIWQSGQYASETSFIITDANDEVLLSAGGSDYTYGDTIMTFDGLCNATIPSSGDTSQTDTTIVTPCNTPTITNVIATATTVTMAWQGTATSYEVGIVAGAWDSTAATVTSAGPSYVFTGLTVNTQYVVGVRAICSNGRTSDWATRTVTTSNEGIADVNAFSFDLYPNPATNVVTVETDADAIVSILDLNGREVIRTNESTIDVSAFAKGTYFVRLTTQEGTAVRKLIVQ